jgi:hypothetical protein
MIASAPQSSRPALNEQSLPTKPIAYSEPEEFREIAVPSAERS